MKKTIELTDQEINIILYALQKQPYELVNEPIKNILSQLQAYSNSLNTDIIK